jgi:hypothetical protein
VGVGGRLESDVSRARFAAIGTDARRPVVRGVGPTARAALADAQGAGSLLHDGLGTELVVRISAEQARRIKAGTVACEALGIVLVPTASGGYREQGGGRPPLETARRRVLSTRVSDVELGMCLGAAEAHGETLADWLRRVAMRSAV